MTEEHEQGQNSFGAYQRIAARQSFENQQRQREGGSLTSLPVVREREGEKGKKENGKRERERASHALAKKKKRERGRRHARLLVVYFLAVAWL